MKTCCVCRNERPLSDFRKQAKASDGMNPMCRGCINEYQRCWRIKNPERVKRYSRIGQLRRNYGMTLEGYSQMIEEQDNRCAICGATSPGDNCNFFHVDHDHRSGVVRGLLCGMCNKGLGCFRDDQVLLQKAQHYLHELLKENNDKT